MKKLLDEMYLCHAVIHATLESINPLSQPVSVVLAHLLLVSRTEHYLECLRKRRRFE